MSIEPVRRPVRISILTPTWNRAALLPRLFDSLLRAHDGSFKFEWLVLDDGSTDDTAHFIETATAAAPFALRYFALSRGGKHRALARGFEEAKGEWMVIVDSDDTLSTGALALLSQALSCADVERASIAFFAMHVPGRERQYEFQAPDRAASLIERYAAEPWFDTTIAIRKTHPHLRVGDFPGETFLSEGHLVFGMPPETRCFLSNDVIVEVEYQPDGLSSRSLELRMASPQGAMATYRRMSEFGLPFGPTLRARLNYGRFWWHAVLRRRAPLAPRGWRDRLALVPGLALALIDFPRAFWSRH